MKKKDEQPLEKLSKTASTEDQAARTRKITVAYCKIL